MSNKGFIYLVVRAKCIIYLVGTINFWSNRLFINVLAKTILFLLILHYHIFYIWYINDILAIIYEYFSINFFFQIFNGAIAPYKNLFKRLTIVSSDVSFY